MSAQKSAQKASRSQQPLTHTVGRRKKAIARAWVRRGTGKVLVNGVDVKEYFDTPLSVQNATESVRVIPVSSQYDIDITVSGGGKEGQSDATKLAIARSLLSLDETLRPALRQYRLLTVDDRNKERKKYGRKAARRRFQFVKR